MNALPKDKGSIERTDQIRNEAAECLPGSILQIRNEEGLPLLHASDCFYEMTGYSPEEIKDRFDGRLSGLIHSEDAQTIRQCLPTELKESRFASRILRLRHKLGHWLWAVFQIAQDRGDEAGNALICLVVDITDLKRMQESLRMSVERHQAILDQTADIIYEWDIAEDRISLSLNWVKRFGYVPKLLSVKSILESDHMIHPDDRSEFRAIAEKLRSGIRFVQADIRIQTAYGQTAWCRIRGTTQYGTDGRPAKAVGIILNIDEEREMVKQLRERAEHDALTGLYNKMTTQSLIQDYLRSMGPNDIGALLLLDIDDFKHLNDTHGHLHGDSVLAQASCAMKKLIRSSDIVGRIGGDEFMVFIKNIPFDVFAVRKAEQIIETLRQAPFSLTCSIGIAVVRNDKARFNDLYQAADQALYQAKNSGKGQTCLYTGARLACEMADKPGSFSVIGAPIESDQHGRGLLGQVMEHAFQAMDGTDDFAQVVEQSLGFVGERFDLSRAFIFEYTTDGQFADNTFEWRRGGVPPPTPWHRRLSIRVLQEYLGYMDADGCFYGSDARAMPQKLQAYTSRNDVRSTLQCSIRKQSVPIGLLCFEQRVDRRAWTQKEVETLKASSRILGIFLAKAREQERKETRARQMCALLDRQPGWIYAVDPERHQLLYCNQTLVQTVQGLRIGMRCYEALAHRKTPCEHCPMALSLRGEGGESELKDTPVGQWTAMHAVPVQWGKKDAYLLSGYDIRRYKQGL